MRFWPVLIVLGIVLVVAGVFVASNQVSINQGNVCGADGCMNVSGSVPVVAPGALLLIVGVVLAAYGFTKRKSDDED